ncbi:hypothetical protein PY32053_01828 [Paracoccus yeei]|uniref:Uncharacterized protein n=1 Tax=Paracoccus yeei TaxID=147645 RepID=A0A386UL56_9RHOB|nr:hypothetical protein PY32053_01828 [Paracoccus yeei]
MRPARLAKARVSLGRQDLRKGRRRRANGTGATRASPKKLRPGQWPSRSKRQPPHRGPPEPPHRPAGAKALMLRQHRPPSCHGRSQGIADQGLGSAGCGLRHPRPRSPACQHASLSEPESPQTCNACQPVTPASLHARNPAKSPGARRPPTPAISQPRQPADPTSPSAKADHLRSPPERGPKDPLRDPGMRSATHATRHRPPAGPRGPGTHEAGRGSMHTPDTPPSASAPSPRR